MIETIIAKSDGETLRSHTQKLMNVVYENAIRNSIDIIDGGKFLSQLIYACTFHDIGKCISSWQEYIKNPTQVSNLPKHSLISALYVSNRMGSVNMDNCVVLRSILYHHQIDKHLIDGISTNAYANDRCVLDAVYDELYSMYEQFCKEHNISVYYAYREYDVDEPIMSQSLGYLIDSSDNMDSGVYNTKFILMRCMLVHADIIASNSNLTDFDLTPNVYNMYKMPSHYDINRYNEQERLVNDMTNPLNVLIAPTGFGKTHTSLRYILKSGKKGFVVTPQNIIAENYYQEIIKELEISGLDGDVTVALLLTGRFIHGSLDSDIIVTNIDNVFNPIMKTTFNDMSAHIYERTAVFDEFDGFVCESPLMEAFCQLLEVRNLIGNTNTLLMSATDESRFYNKYQYKKIQPNINTRLQSTVNVTVLQGVFNVDLKSTDTLLLCNTVTDAQRYYCNGIVDEIIHSRYMSSVLSAKKSDLISDKSKNGRHSNLSYVSTNLIERGIDVSFSRGVFVNYAPDDILQADGRIGRFNNNTSDIVLFHDIDSKNRADIMYLKNNYLTEIVDEWFKFLECRIGYNNTVTMTRAELYALVDEFKALPNVRTLYNNRFKRMLYYSKKTFSKLSYSRGVSEDDGYKHISRKANLRYTEGVFQIFVKVKDLSGNWISEPISVDNQFIGKELFDIFNTPKYQSTLLKNVLAAANASEYGHKKKLERMLEDKGNLVDYLLSLATTDNTAFYIHEKLFYDDELGLRRR